MTTTRTAKRSSPTQPGLKSALFTLICLGFVAGMFFLGAIWFSVSEIETMGILLSAILLFISLTLVLMCIRVYANISLMLAQNDQKHLQNALVQAKDMIDTNKQLRDDFTLLQTLLHNLPFPVWLKDRFGRYLVANTHFTQQWSNGVNPIGKTDDELLNSTLAKAFSEADQRALNNHVPERLELRLDLKNTSLRWFRIERYALTNDANESVGVVGFAHDITQYKQTAEITAHTDTDALTGFYNKSGLDKKFSQTLSSENPVWCIHIDLDHFKVVNDSLGQTSGDELLVQVAGRIKEACRDGDFYSRPSADEFLLFWYGSDDEDHNQRLIDLHHQISQAMELHGESYRLTASIGLAKSPDHGDSYQDLHKHAGVALFNAKKRGRNQIHWYRAAYENQALRRLNKDQTLQQAITDQSFVLHCQPRIHTKTGAIEALECLVRIQSRDSELIYPNQFIGLAEQNGSIRIIDRFVLEFALKQVRQWIKDNQEPIALAVNLSVASVQDELIELLEEWQAKHPEVLDYIELELTEHQFPGDDSGFVKRLKSIKALGVTLALDDFGTGYANLSRLPEWPFDIVKLDRSFMVDLKDSEKQQAVVKSIIDLCKTLGIKTVAEGIEDHESLELVDQLGCSIVQGFVYAHPKPLNTADDWLEKRKLSAQ